MDVVTARLLVERGSFRDQTQDWGEFEFLGLPSPADRVTVPHDGETHFLTVLCVHHAPVQLGGGSNRAPAASVVAKWTGSE